MGDEKNDYDRLAEYMDGVMECLAGGSFEGEIESTAVLVSKDEWIKSIIRLQRMKNWCQGLAESQRRFNEGVGREDA